MALTLPAEEAVIHEATGPITLMPGAIPQTTGPIDKDAYPAEGIEAIVKFTKFVRMFFPITGQSDGVVNRFYLKDMLPADIKMFQSVPDNFLTASNPNTQYRADNVGVNCDGVSYANADKPSSTYVLTSNKVTSLNLTTAISLRKRARDLGLSVSHIHSATYWHNGHTSSQAWTASDWRAQLDIAINGWIDGLHAEGLWNGTETWDLINETVDDANSTAVAPSGASPFVRQSKLTIAAKADTGWASEMAAFGLSAVDAGNLGWLYALYRAKQKMTANGHVARILKADYSVGDSGTAWGPGTASPGTVANGHFMMRLERFFHELQLADIVRKAGYDMAPLHVNFQTHVKLSNQLFLDDIRDRQQRCNLLKKRVTLGEVTLELIDADIALMLGSIGVPVTAATVRRLARNYISMLLATIIEHTEKLDMIQCWTALGAVGEMVSTAYETDGKITAVYEGIQRAAQILRPRKAIRAASTHFGLPGSTFRPLDFIPGANVQISSPAGLRAPGSKLPWTHYLRALVEDGPVVPMDTKNWDQAVTFTASGSAASLNGVMIWGQESAAGNSLRFVFDNFYGLVMQVYPSDGSAMQSFPLGLVGAGNYARVAFGARNDGRLMAALSVYDVAAGTVTDRAPVTANVRIADPVNYLMPETVSRGVYRHKIWDTTDLAADASAMSEKARVSTRMGSPLSVQQIWDGVLP